MPIMWENAALFASRAIAFLLVSTVPAGIIANIASFAGRAGIIADIIAAISEVTVGIGIVVGIRAY